MFDNVEVGDTVIVTRIGYIWVGMLTVQRITKSTIIAGGYKFNRKTGNIIPRINNMYITSIDKKEK